MFVFEYVVFVFEYYEQLTCDEKKMGGLLQPNLSQRGNFHLVSLALYRSDLQPQNAFKEFQLGERNQGDFWKACRRS